MLLLLVEGIRKEGILEGAEDKLHILEEVEDKIHILEGVADKLLVDHLLEVVLLEAVEETHQVADLLVVEEVAEIHLVEEVENLLEVVVDRLEGELELSCYKKLKN